MSSYVCFPNDGGGLWLSNMRLSTLVGFALEIGETRPDGNAFCRALSAWWDTEYFNGANFDLAQRFPTLDQRKFWSVCFFDLARRIFLRQIGNHEITYWQTSAIAESVLIAQALTRSVQNIESGWFPVTEDGLESSAKLSSGTTAAD